MYTLNEYDMVKVDQARYCRYCGEPVVAKGSYHNHGRDYDEDYHCECAGALESLQLRDKVYEAFSKYQYLESELKKYQHGCLHINVKKLQLEEELKSIRSKYNAEIVYVIKEEK